MKKTVNLLVIILLTSTICYSQRTNNFSLYELGRATAEEWEATGEDYMYPQNTGLMVSLNKCNNTANTQISMGQFRSGSYEKQIIENLHSVADGILAVVRIKVFTLDKDSSITNPFIKHIASVSKNYTFTYYDPMGYTGVLVGTQGNYYSDLNYYGSTGILFDGMIGVGGWIKLFYRDFYNYDNFNDAQVEFTVGTGL